MKLKSTFLYQMRESRNTILIFYGFLCSFMILYLFGCLTSNSEHSIYGINSATIIFLFIYGCISFMQGFPLYLQNGVSRKTMFKARLLSNTCIALIMTIANQLLVVIVNFLFSLFPATQSQYGKFMGEFSAIYFWNKPLFTFENIMWSMLISFVSSLLVLFLAFFFSSLAYRIPLKFRALFFAGVPIVLFCVCPLIISGFVTDDMIYAFINNVSLFFGVSNHQPINFVGIFGIMSVIMAGLSWLFTRRAVIITK